MPRAKKNPDAQGESQRQANTGPAEVRRQLHTLASATNAPPPDALTKPTVNIAAPPAQLAAEVGMHLASAPIFMHSTGLVTVDERTGEMKRMTERRFVTWVDPYFDFVQWSQEGSKISKIGKDLAAILMESDQMLAHVRKLNVVAKVRLPLWGYDQEGNRSDVYLAPPGYDPRSGVFTLDEVPYPDDVKLVDAFQSIHRRIGGFPFDAEGQPNIKQRRSYAAYFAALLGVYCYNLLPPGTPRPLVIFKANQPGAGKSVLARTILCPLHGAVIEHKKPRADQEFEKLLESITLSGRPYLFLDNVSHLASDALDQFVSSPYHGCRRMYSQDEAAVPNMTQVFITGNNLTLKEDLERRALHVILFDAGESLAREIPPDEDITEELVQSPAFRAEMLAACWAFVANWRDAGRPRSPWRLQSFETFTTVIGGILHAAAPNTGFHNPFTRPALASSGDDRSRALRAVLAKIAGQWREGDDQLVTTPQGILDTAEDMGLADQLTNYAEHPRKALGHVMGSNKGRHFVDSKGRTFEFGKRDCEAGAAYPITFLDLQEQGKMPF